MGVCVEHTFFPIHIFQFGDSMGWLFAAMELQWFVKIRNPFGPLLCCFTWVETFGVTFWDGWGAEFHGPGIPGRMLGWLPGIPVASGFKIGCALDKASCLTCFTEYELFLIRFHSLVQGEAFHTFSGSLRTSGGGWDQGRRVPFCGISDGYWMILLYVGYSLIGEMWKEFASLNLMYLDGWI